MKECYFVIWNISFFYFCSAQVQLRCTNLGRLRWLCSTRCLLFESISRFFKYVIKEGLQIKDRPKLIDDHWNLAKTVLNFPPKSEKCQLLKETNMFPSAHVKIAQ